ncbi:MAG: ribonuclease III [Lachnospiraceae bacterium]|nr:ribonuclease III [Lachnospiraceae bacterium]
MGNNTVDLCELIIAGLNDKEPDIRTYSPLTLAYIGDAIYEVVVRTHVVSKGNMPVNKLHGISSNLVKAETQAKLVKLLEDELTDEEKIALKRGCNSKPYTKAKNASMTDYLTATGFEAMMGYLYLKNEMDRIIYLVKEGFIRLGEIQ